MSYPSITITFRGKGSRMEV